MKFTDRLYADSEAKDWNAAYPLGNGLLGVMVDGGVSSETFYLNDGTYWSGSFDGTSFRANDVFPRVKELAMAGKLTEAEDLLYKEVYGDYVESYLPLCELHLKKTNVCGDNYSRILDITRGISEVKYGRSREECFATHVDRAFCLKITGDKAVRYSFDMTSVTHYDVEYSSNGGTGYIVLHDIAPSHLDPKGHEQENPIVYDENKPSIHAIVRVRIDTDGEVIASDNLTINNASYIELRLVATTNYRDKDFEEMTVKMLDDVAKVGYEELKNRHITDFGELYNRCSLELGDKHLPESMTTVRALQKKHKNPDIAVLLFNYARYLMISASREDSQCMNLQGIWNNMFHPNWSSAYTVNINIEMNYWIAETVGLGECHMPLMRQLVAMEKNGRKTAREQLHADGWCCGHNSDIWAHTDLTGRTSTFNPTQYALYISGGAWMSTHIYRHYKATHDEDFLRKYYYILRGSAEFYLSYLMEDTESEYLVFCPSASPENTFKHNGELHSLSKNSTMDTAIARHIFNIIEEVGGIVGEDEVFLDKCKRAKSKLMPYRIGRAGELLEWYDNYDETEKTHRHISHLYGLFPDNQITLDGTPELAKAAKKTINRRGTRGIGWSLTWRAAFLARLGEGDWALKAIHQKTKHYNEKIPGLNYGGCYDNLFSAPPMQIDGNFGIAAAIVEMLLRTYDGKLLPALPKAWKCGAFKGFRTADGKVIDYSWNNSK